MVLQSVLGDKLLFAETALCDLVVTVLFEDVPSQVSNRERLIAKLTFHFFSMVGQDVLIQMGNLSKDQMFLNVQCVFNLFSKLNVFPPVCHKCDNFLSALPHPPLPPQCWLLLLLDLASDPLSPAQQELQNRPGLWTGPKRHHQHWR